MLANKGKEGGKGLDANRALRALTGHKKWLSIDGS